MKFCMITSFFGRHSFGGDSVYVERLSAALLRRGHEVHVVHSSGAFGITRGRQPLRTYQPPQGLRIHDLGGGVTGMVGALWSHQSGGIAFRKQALARLFEQHAFDVVHLHNVSLLGGRHLPRLLAARTNAVKLVTAHDYWWVCPQSLLWKYGTKVCDAPACVSCSILARRPPQFWRRDGWFNDALAGLDGLLFPSRRAMEIYQTRGLRHPQRHVLPGLIPAGWASGGTRNPAHGTPGERPYFATAGRLVIEKGIQALIPLMRHLPEFELRIAGSGPAESLLRKQARGLPNIRFLGLLDARQVRALFQGARAVVVPSLFEETFCLVAAEALTVGTPVIARNRGSLPELIGATAGGLLFDEEAGMLNHLRSLARDDALRNRMRHAARAAAPRAWYEEAHTEAYLQVIGDLSRSRGKALRA